MTRGNARVPATAVASGTRPQKRPAKSKASKVAPRSKRARTTAPSTTTQGPVPPVLKVAHPSQLERVPLTRSAQPPQQSPQLQDIAAIISGAVIEGLKVAGIFSEVPKVPTTEDSNQVASAQGSVAAVVQDITGEHNSPLASQNNTNITAHNVSVVSDPLVGALGRPELVPKQMAVPLASRISDKIQSNIWTNEYADFGTLLQRSYANDLKYNFVVQASPSADWPVISLEPAQKPKRIATIDQWVTAFETFVAIYTAKFPNDAPALMKHLCL